MSEHPAAVDDMSLMPRTNRLVTTTTATQPAPAEHQVGADRPGATTADTPQAAPPLAVLSLANVVEDLSAEFDATLGIRTVVLVVRQCQRELDASGSSPGLLRTLARRQLLGLLLKDAKARC